MHALNQFREAAFERFDVFEVLLARVFENALRTVEFSLKGVVVLVVFLLVALALEGDSKVTLCGVAAELARLEVLSEREVSVGGAVAWLWFGDLY